MKRVLLTGATGLIGKYAIQPLIDEGFEVFAVSSKEQTPQNGIRWIEADLLNFSSIGEIFETIKPQHLLHFAWDTTPGSYLESNLNFEWVLASLEMLKQFNLHGGKRAVFAGTCFEYEFQDEPLKEDDKLNPTSTYAKCKNYLNQVATLYSETNNISFGWGRIFYVYGKGEQEKRLFPYVINSLKNDEEIVISSGELIKDYIFAADIAAGFVKFLDTNVCGCVNICTGNPIKIKEIVSLIASKLGKEHLVKFDYACSNQPPIIIGDNSRLTNEVRYKNFYTLNSALDLIIEENQDEQM